MTENQMGSERIIGNRFKLVSQLKVSTIGELYRGEDLTTNKSVNIRYFPQGFFSEAEISLLGELMQKCATLTHRNIVLSLGIGIDNGAVFIVQEPLTGVSLSYLLQERLRTNKPFSLKAVYNIITHTINGIHYAEKTFSHGVLSPDTILITDSGRVKILDFGVSQLLYTKEKFLQKEGGKIKAFIAPELLKSPNLRPDVKCDIYSIGVLIHTIITGEIPEDIEKGKLKDHPLISSKLKSLILHTISFDREKRIGELLEVKTILKEILDEWEKAHPESVSEEDDILIEIDLEPVQLVKEKPLTPKPLFQVETSGKISKQIQPSVQEKKPPIPQPLLNEPNLPPLQLKEPKEDKIDIDSLLSSFSAVDVPKWMVQKDNLDHGPFSTREMVQQIMMGNISGHHIAIDMDTGIRKRVDAWQQFVKVVEQYKIQKQKEEEQKALERAHKVEKHGAWLKVVIALGIIAFIGVTITIYFMALKSKRESERISTEQFASLIASGEIKFKGGAGILQSEERVGGRRQRGGKEGSSGIMSAEEAMNKAVDYGNLTGSMRMLSSAQINSVMIQNQKLFYPCLLQEYNRNSRYHRVDIDMVIEGSGKVIGVSLPGANPELASCMKAKMMQIKFPSFDAPRMRVTYFFEIGN